MPLLVECACGKKLSVRDELAGKKVKCPKCGQVLVAPRRTVVDAPTQVIVGPPPPKVETPTVETESAITEEPRPKSAWDEEKPQKRARPADEHVPDEDVPEDDDEDKPGPHWVFPGTLSTEVMALGREGIWFASLKGDALKKAIRSLEKGNEPRNVLGEKAYFFPWISLTSIYCNRKLNGFTITYKDTAGETSSKVLTPADRDERDAIMKAIEDYMKPDVKRTVVKHTPITAMAAPILAITITFFITLGIAALSLCIGGDWEGKGRGAAVAALFNLLDWVGPFGSCGCGGLIGALMVPWMIVRMINPPVEVTLIPVVSKVSEEDQ